MSYNSILCIAILMVVVPPSIICLQYLFQKAHRYFFRRTLKVQGRFSNGGWFVKWQ